MSLVYFATGAAFQTIGDCNGADISIPATANTLGEAVQEIKTSFNFDDVEVKEVQVVDYHGSQKLLIVRTADEAAPAVLLFTPADDGEQAAGASAIR